MAAREENGRWATKRRKVNSLVNENHYRCNAVRMDSALLLGKGHR